MDLVCSAGQPYTGAMAGNEFLQKIWLRFTAEQLARIDKDAVEGGINLWSQSSDAS